MARKKSKDSRPTGQQAPAEQLAAALASYQDLLSPDGFDRLLQAIRQPLPTAIRLNPLKIADPTTAVAGWSSRYGWQPESLPFCSTGFQLLPSQAPSSATGPDPGQPPSTIAPYLPPSRTIEYRLGQYYIQEAASMLPVELFTLKPPTQAGFPLILDLAAAPGGKTTHLVSRWLDQALVLANDPAAGRLPALRSALQDWGAANIAVTNFPGELFGGWYPETFDYVLLDAPCSMENLRPGASLPRGRLSPRQMSSRERQGLAQRQLRLLISGFQALKTGGQIVYATCTLAPEEDETVLEGLLRLYPAQVRIESTSWPGEPAPALAAYQGIPFHPSIQNAIRLWPHLTGTSGFFTALITKLSPVKNRPQEPPHRLFSVTGFLPLTPHEQTALIQSFAEDFAFNLENLLEIQKLALWRRGSTIYTLPESFFAHFPNLPCSGLGLPLGDESPDGFILSHAWAARYGSQFENGHYLLPEEFTARWLNGEDLRGLPRSGGHRSTLIVIDAAGRNLGRGRFSGDRLRNLLPKK
jgi:16S rRNA (cytosine1407-C5)-methyltransferase